MIKTREFCFVKLDRKGGLVRVSSSAFEGAQRMTDDAFQAIRAKIASDRTPAIAEAELLSSDLAAVEKRKKLYEIRGLTRAAFMDAMMQKTFDNDDAALSAFEAARVSVKALVPLE